MSTARIKRRKQALAEIDKIYESLSDVLVIHYSCENFYENTSGKTQRIIAIAIRKVKSGQTTSFSIHLQAELKRIVPDQIPKQNDVLEKEMLQSFFHFVKDHKSHKWVHWKMRDVNYGFYAIEHRFRSLGGTPESIDDDKKFQLSELLKDIYGPKYISQPRMYKLFQKNHINDKHLLPAEGDFECLNAKDYVRLHKSILCKVEALEVMFKKTVERSLKTDAKIWDVYGLSPQAIFVLCKTHWFWALISFLLSLFLAGYAGWNISEYLQNKKESQKISALSQMPGVNKIMVSTPVYVIQ